MDYEKAYKQALERARKLKENPKAIFFEEKNIHVSDYIFPELKESNDEKIRKGLIKYFKNFDSESLYTVGLNEGEIISWLEKQGEQNPTDKVKPKFKVGDVMRTLQEAADGMTDGMPVITSVDEEYYHCTNELIAMKDQDEYEYPPMNRRQKPTDKVEPKFHEGDWITNGYDTWKIVEVKPLDYILQSQDGNIIDDTISYVDALFDSFTIQDAKDGDVVVDKSDGTIGIFECIGHHPDGGSYNDSSYCFLHCRYDDGFFYADFEHGNTIDSDDLIPATEEQRDLLFKKMHEAGYEWDKEKKELRKIEQKSTWSEEDENILDDIKLAIASYWDEDTENNILDWLKSLKQRYTWKPSDEQIKALKETCDEHWEPDGLDPLYTLYEDLEKLKGG